ncbi:MAG: ABC transporter permease [Phycisphaerae bacterium]|nr:ABC transporter permease [Phycisphaerae bacterium]
MRYLSVFLCLKYLRKRKIVLLSVAAVAMSCALLITVASLFTGFINAVENGAGEHMGDIMILPPSGLRIPDYDVLIKELEKEDAIVGGTAVLTSQGLLLLSQGDVRAVKIWGIELPERTKVTPVDEFLVKAMPKGAPPTFALEEDSEELGGFVGIGVLGEPDEVTDEYNLDAVRSAYIGKRVLLTTGAISDAGRNQNLEDAAESSGSTAQRFKRRTIRFKIANIVFSGMHEFDKNFVYLPIAMIAEELYPGQGKIADIVQIRLRKGVDANAQMERVQTIWNDFAEGRFSWARYAQIESARQMQAQLIAEYRKQMGMLMLIFGVVSFGVVLLIFCIFYLIVMTRRKDIAIVKSCGLSSSAVATMFLTFGLGVGLAGSGLGVALGWIFTRNINVIEHWISVAFGLKLWKSSTYMFSRIPNQVDWPSVAWVAAAAILAAGVGALIPAVAAARVRPVRILRYE